MWAVIQQLIDRSVHPIFVQVLFNVLPADFLRRERVIVLILLLCVSHNLRLWKSGATHAEKSEQQQMTSGADLERAVAKTLPRTTATVHFPAQVNRDYSTPIRKPSQDAIIHCTRPHPWTGPIWAQYMTDLGYVRRAKQP